MIKPILKPLFRYGKFVYLMDGVNNYAVFDSPLVFAGDYEIEFDYFFDGGSVVDIRVYGQLSLFNSRLRILRTNGRAEARPSVTVSTTISSDTNVFTPGQYAKVGVKRVAGMATITKNGVAISTPTEVLGETSIEGIGINGGIVTSPIRLWNIKAWSNGDRNTGVLMHWPFNNPGSSVQISMPAGNNLTIVNMIAANWLATH